MRYRLTFFAGLAIGFVLGARAGRERYEQLKAFARKVADSPAVQQAAGAMQAQASDLAKSAGRGVADRMPRMTEARRRVRTTVAGRVPGMPGRGQARRHPEADGSGAYPGAGRRGRGTGH